jgi:hypothetical protein
MTTTTLVFYLGDTRLRDDERQRLLQISNNLTARPFDRVPTVPDPVKLAEQYWKPADGDL